MATIQFDLGEECSFQAIDAVARQTMNMDMPWDWPCGVAYYGLVRGVPEPTGQGRIPAADEGADGRD